MKNIKFENILASYIGFAIGDAFGATTEFMTANEVNKKYGTLTKIIGGGWLNIKAGNVTDDTEMCIYLGDSIIDNNGFNVRYAGDYFVKWMRNKPIDIGNTIRSGIIGYMKRNQIESPFSDMSAGNGAAMRNLPMVIYCLKDWSYFEKLTIQHSHITHNNDISDKITLIFGELTKVLLETGDKLKALSIASEFIIKNPKFSFSRYNGENSGYIVDTFKCVMHHFFDGTSFEDILIRVVNQGGDADTNAALAGMLAGALYGMKGIPNKWLNKMNRQVINKITYQAETLSKIPCIEL